MFSYVILSDKRIPNEINTINVVEFILTTYLIRESQFKIEVYKIVFLKFRIIIHYTIV